MLSSPPYDLPWTPSAFLPPKSAASILILQCFACSAPPGEHSLDETFARADSLASDGKLVEAGRLLAELASTRESRRAAFSAANYLADAGVHATPLA